jgi:hypothetical protein
MYDSYPLVPITSNQALGIALLTYNGVLHWGFQADWDAVPDLHDFVLAVDAEFAALSDACRPLTLRSVPEPVSTVAAQAARPTKRTRRPKKRRTREISPDAR